MHRLPELLPHLGWWLVPPLLGLTLWFATWRRRPLQAFRFNPLKFGLFLTAFAIALGLFRGGWALSAISFGTMGLALLLDFVRHERNRHLPRTSDSRTWQILGIVALLAFALAFWQQPLAHNHMRYSTMGLHIGPLPIELLIWSVGITLLGLLPGPRLSMPPPASGKR